jgi:hypothetical protein
MNWNWYWNPLTISFIVVIVLLSTLTLVKSWNLPSRISDEVDLFNKDCWPILNTNTGLFENPCEKSQ